MIESKFFRRWLNFCEELDGELGQSQAQLAPHLIHHMAHFKNSLVTGSFLPPTSAWQDYGLSCDAVTQGQTLLVRATWVWGEVGMNVGEEVQSWFYFGVLPIDNWQSSIVPEDLRQRLELFLLAEH